MISAKLMLHRVHKWMGLVAAAWLLLLGLTGFLLDHRETWQWLWQAGPVEKWLPGKVVGKSQSTRIRLYQVNEDDPVQQVAGGLTGLWWSGDAGRSWEQTRFKNSASPPMLYAVFFAGNNRLWMASDDGIWLSTDNGQTARQSILTGNNVTALSQGASASELVGVTDRTKVFKYNIVKKKLYWLSLGPVTEKNLPAQINLSRFARDIHYGRGVFTTTVSLLWNDITALAMIILPLSGFFFYWLPRKWRRNYQQQKAISHHYKKQAMRWLFRLHGPTFGLVAAIPLLYLSVSGILLDHATELRQWMGASRVTRSWQTPVYSLTSWDHEIYGVVSYQGQAQKISIATRLGLFTSTNDGRDWQRENILGNKSLFVWTLRKFKDDIYIGGMGSPNFSKRGDQSWHIVKGSGHMPSDITRDKDANVLWKSHHGVLSTGTQPGNRIDIDFPETGYVPWFYVIDALHTGMLFHTQWKWINDFIAIMAILLVFTGLLRWWRKKWI